MSRQKSSHRWKRAGDTETDAPLAAALFMSIDAFRKLYKTFTLPDIEGLSRPTENGIRWLRKDYAPSISLTHKFGEIYEPTALEVPAAPRFDQVGDFQYITSTTHREDAIEFPAFVQAVKALHAAGLPQPKIYYGSSGLLLVSQLPQRPADIMEFKLNGEIISTPIAAPSQSYEMMIEYEKHKKQGKRVDIEDIINSLQAEPISKAKLKEKRLEVEIKTVKRETTKITDHITELEQTPAQPIQDFQKQIREFSKQIAEQIAQVLGKLNKDTERWLQKEMRSGNMLELINLFTQLEKEKFTLKRQHAIMKEGRQLIDQYRAALQTAEKRLAGIKAPFTAYQIALPKHYENEFIAEVQKQIPEMQHDYQKSDHLYIPPKQATQFDQLLDTFNKKTMEYDRRNKVLESIKSQDSIKLTPFYGKTNETNQALSREKHALANLQSLLRRSSRPEKVAQLKADIAEKNKHIMETEKKLKDAEDELHSALITQGYSQGQTGKWSKAPPEGQIEAWSAGSLWVEVKK